MHSLLKALLFALFVRCCLCSMFIRMHLVSIQDFLAIQNSRINACKCFALGHWNDSPSEPQAVRLIWKPLKSVHFQTAVPWRYKEPVFLLFSFTAIIANPQWLLLHPAASWLIYCPKKKKQVKTGLLLLPSSVWLQNTTGHILF